MAKEILNLEFNNACLVIKAINWKGSVKAAAEVLGVCDTTVYEIIRRTPSLIFDCRLQKTQCEVQWLAS
jgi:hypothetical protein